MKAYANHRHRFLIPKICAIAVCLFLVIFTAELVTRIGTLFSPTVEYLASAGTGSVPQVFKDLNHFINNYSVHLIPHRDWNNYWTNALGFNDKEFDFPKPKGRFRIIALGDSFCYGMVKYPDNVLTLTEKNLRERFKNTDLDLLNLGIPGTGPWEYSTLLGLIDQRAQPDLVVVHLYLGNDTPNLLQRSPFGTAANPWKRSFAYRYIKNSLLLLSTTAETSATNNVPSNKAIGGHQIRPGKDLLEPPPSPFSEEQYLKTLTNELGRFYRPPNFEAAMNDRWKRLRSQLEAIKAESLKNGAQFAIVLYPSQLQIYSRIREKTFAFSRQQKEFRNVNYEDFDFSLPNAVIKELAHEILVPFLDMTDKFKAAVQEGETSLYLERDTHWNTLGNSLAAEIEAEFLRKLIR